MDDQLIEQAIQGHAGTRDAMRWLIAQVRGDANTHQQPSVSESNTHQSEERIDELAFEAGCYRNKYCDPNRPDLEGYIISQSVLEKFAALIEREVRGDAEPVAWMYTLEYGDTVANKKVSLSQLNYPFGVCGADYLRENSDGMSYVRQTPLYAQPALSAAKEVGL